MLVLGTDGKAERMKLETGKKKRPASWIPDHVVSTHHGPANQVGSFVIRDFSGNESLRAIFLARNFNFAWDRGSTVNVFFCLASATAIELHRRSGSTPKSCSALLFSPFQTCSDSNKQCTMTLHRENP
jgi:hypothetical protein